MPDVPLCDGGGPFSADLRAALTAAGAGHDPTPMEPFQSGDFCCMTCGRKEATLDA